MLNIFRAGKHTDSLGRDRAFTKEDIAKSQKYYDPAKHEAPIVIGHPIANAPAYGWVSAIAQQGDQLFATEKQVEPQFAELRKQGRFKKISASFYEPNSVNHPLKNQEGHDSWYLKHVGFLGAQPPAIKGLAQASFSESEEGVIEFAEFMDYDCMTIAQLFRGLREFLISQYTPEEIDKIIPSSAIDDLLISAAREEQPKENPMTEVPVNYAEQTAELESLRAENSALKQKEQEAEFSEYLDTLKGKIMPREKKELISLLMAFSGKGEVCFSENGKLVSKPALDVFKRSLEVREIKFDLNPAPETVDFAESPEEVAQAAVDYQTAQGAKGNKISMTQAVAHIQKGAKR